MASTEPRRGEIWLDSLGAAAKREAGGKNRPAIVVLVGKAGSRTLEEIEDVLVTVLGLEPARSAAGGRET